jgi:hypothetical protein
MFGRRRTTRDQARRDREWRRFVDDLTEPANQISPAEDERMREYLAGEAQARAEVETDAGVARRYPPAERAA